MKNDDKDELYLFWTFYVIIIQHVYTLNWYTIIFIWQSKIWRNIKRNGKSEIKAKDTFIMKDNNLFSSNCWKNN